MTPTPSRTSPLRRLAPLRRVPFWAQALAICALFAIAGVAVVDDYGVTSDEQSGQRIARTTLIYVLDYTLGASEEPSYRFSEERYYGVAFLLPLLLAERALGLEDTRHIYLMRHMLTHLFFIAGGFACALLAYRMLGSRWIALFAMLLFLLHPRLYAHSFFNARDIPFAVALIIALYLAHRAFRKDTIGAFLLCGAGVGLAIDLRVFGLMLPPMILAMRALDLWQAGAGERKRILMTGAAFAIATMTTVYIIHPYYWENPLRFIEGVRALSRHPYLIDSLFMGEIYSVYALPWNFIPVWFAITAPPVALTLGGLGAAAVCWQAIARPLAALRDRETRFRVLSLGCFALPVVVTIALQGGIYNDWRHMYFLWGPFCLLAAVGLRALASGGAGLGKWNIAARLPGWARCRRRRLHMARRTLAHGMAGFGLITTLTAMAALHPYQQVYFNALTDTKTPGALANRYDMDYWQSAQLQALEYLLDRYPDGVLSVYPKNNFARILPQKDRDRIIILENPPAADFYLALDSRPQPPLTEKAGNILRAHPRIDLQTIPGPPLHAIYAYGSPLASIVAKRNVVDSYRAAYEDVEANGTLLARSDFDIYAYDDALYYLSDNCPPPMSNDADFWVFLHIIPADLADLPADSREHGFDNRDFRFNDRAAFFDGKCVNRQPLPEYPIARVRTGQIAAASGGEWRVDINLSARAAAQAVYASIAAGDHGKPVAQSDFHLYLSGNGLAYFKEPCVADDADARFFLHIFPVDPAALPSDQREFGFANLDFQFADHGADIGGNCVVTRELPDYPIDRIRTGQFVSGAGRLWSVEFPAAR